MHTFWNLVCGAAVTQLIGVWTLAISIWNNGHPGEENQWPGYWWQNLSLVVVAAIGAVGFVVVNVYFHRKEKPKSATPVEMPKAKVATTAAPAMNKAKADDYQPSHPHAGELTGRRSIDSATEGYAEEHKDDSWWVYTAQGLSAGRLLPLRGLKSGYAVELLGGKTSSLTVSTLAQGITVLCRDIS